MSGVTATPAPETLTLWVENPGEDPVVVPMSPVGDDVYHAARPMLRVDPADAIDLVDVVTRIGTRHRAAATKASNAGAKR